MKIERLPEDHFLIKELADSYVEDWKAKSGQRDHQRRSYFYMSDVGKCRRSIFYDFTCPEKKCPITAKTLMMFAAGNLLHDDLQSRARKRDMVEAARDIEYGLEDWAHKATGRLDLILAVYRFIETEAGIAVAEIKTKNPYNFGDEEPTQEEVDQLLWYIDRLKESGAKSVRKSNVLPYGFILYADRAMISEPLPLAGWRVDFDQDRVDVIKAEFSKLDQAILAGECPDRPHERESIKCRYCRYEEPCWEGVPRIEAPAWVADETIEAPEQELVESMAARFVEIETQAKALKVEGEKIEATLNRYFRAKGVEEIPVNGVIICHSSHPYTRLDDGYLRASVGPETWARISAAKPALIKEAIEAGKLNPEIYERAKITTFSDVIRIKKSKGGKNADQKSE